MFDNQIITIKIQFLCINLLTYDVTIHICNFIELLIPLCNRSVFKMFIAEKRHNRCNVIFTKLEMSRQPYLPIIAL